MHEDLVERLIDKQSGYFHWADREDRLDLYQTELGGPLLATIMDGSGTVAPWSPAFGWNRSYTLFRAIGDISASWTGFYIQDPDDVFSVVRWSRTFETGRTLDSHLLEHFSSDPADQNGMSYLGLFIDNPQNMILFTYAPGKSFRISLFGDMKIRVPDALRRYTG